MKNQVIQLQEDEEANTAKYKENHVKQHKAVEMLIEANGALKRKLDVVEKVALEQQMRRCSGGS